MNVKIKKWGNSLAVRIPRTFASETSVTEGAIVDMSVTRDGKFVLVPTKRISYALSSLLAGIKRGKVHAEISTGPARGKEVW
jgi:antitoxin MazE